MAETAAKYFAKQAPAIRKTAGKLRRLILKTFPGIMEEMRYGVPWYGGRYYIAAFKDHVNVGFSVRGLSKKELALFDGAGKFMSHAKILTQKEKGLEKRIVTLLRISAKSKCSCPPGGQEVRPRGSRRTPL